MFVIVGPWVRGYGRKLFWENRGWVCRVMECTSPSFFFSKLAVFFAEFLVNSYSLPNVRLALILLPAWMMFKKLLEMFSIIRLKYGAFNVSINREQSSLSITGGYTSAAFSLHLWAYSLKLSLSFCTRFWRSLLMGATSQLNLYCFRKASAKSFQEHSLLLSS